RSAHLEGIIVVPNDPAYGPWAGQIVTGDEDRTNVGSPVTAIINGTNPKIYAINPTTGVCIQNSLVAQTSSCTGGTPFDIIGPVPHPEDFDFIEGDFYGNAYNNNGSDTSGSKKGAILKAFSSDFDSTKGNILITQEYPQTSGDTSQIPITSCTNNVDASTGLANSGLYQFLFMGNNTFQSTQIPRNPGDSTILC